MSTRTLTITGFLIVLAVMIAVDLTARLLRRNGPRRWPAPLGTALSAALRSTVGRLLVFGWWLWIGWHFLAR